MSRQAFLIFNISFVGPVPGPLGGSSQSVGGYLVGWFPFQMA